MAVSVLMASNPSHTQKSKFHIVHLPHSHADPASWAALIAEQRAFRLFSLESAPEAFSSTLAREAAFEPSVWEDRLQNPLANTFVAVAEETVSSDKGHKSTSLCNIEKEMVHLLVGTWIGVVVLMGPKKESFVNVTESPWQTLNANSRNENGSSHGSDVLFYHMNAVFTHPDFKGIGVAHSLIEKAFAFSRSQSARTDAKKMRCTILVEKDNVAATRLYQKSGFSIVAEERMLSPRKQKADGTPIPDHSITVFTMMRELEL